MKNSQPYAKTASLITATLIGPVYEKIISELPENGFLLLSEKLLDHLFVLNEKDWIFGDDTKEDWLPFINTYVYIIFGNGKYPKSEEDLLKLTPDTNPGLDVYRFKDAVKEAAMSMNDFKDMATANIANYQLNDFAVAAILAEKNKISLVEQSKTITEIAKKIGLV